MQAPKGRSTRYSGTHPLIGWFLRNESCRSQKSLQCLFRWWRKSFTGTWYPVVHPWRDNWPGSKSAAAISTQFHFPNCLWEFKICQWQQNRYCSIMMKVCNLSLYLHFSAGCCSWEHASRTAERKVNLYAAGRDGSIWHQEAEMLLLVTGVPQNS